MHVFLLNEILKLKQIFRRSVFSLETFLDLGVLGFIMTAIICMQHRMLDVGLHWTVVSRQQS